MAKKFKFRLEKVLEYREVLRNEKKKELYIKNKAVSDAEDRIAQLTNDLLTKRPAFEGGVEAQELHISADYLTRIKALIEETKNSLEILKFEAEQAKDEYIEAVKEHESLKVLKARKLSDYNDHVSQEEAKFLDELSVQKAGRSLITKRQN